VVLLRIFSSIFVLMWYNESSAVTNLHRIISQLFERANTCTAIHVLTLSNTGVRIARVGARSLLHSPYRALWACSVCFNSTCRFMLLLQSVLQRVGSCYSMQCSISVCV